MKFKLIINGDTCIKNCNRIKYSHNNHVIARGLRMTIMLTRINTRVAYLERKKMEINIWHSKKKKKREREKCISLNFLTSNITKESQCVSPLML